MRRIVRIRWVEPAVWLILLLMIVGTLLVPKWERASSAQSVDEQCCRYQGDQHDNR